MTERSEPNALTELGSKPLLDVVEDWLINEEARVRAMPIDQNTAYDRGYVDGSLHTLKLTMGKVMATKQTSNAEGQHHE